MYNYIYAGSLLGPCRVFAGSMLGLRRVHAGSSPGLAVLPAAKCCVFAGTMLGSCWTIIPATKCWKYAGSLLNINYFQQQNAGSCRVHAGILLDSKMLGSRWVSAGICWVKS